MKILKMTMELGDNDLYKTTVIAENGKRAFTCVMVIYKELLLDGAFGEMLSDTLIGQYNHLIASDEIGKSRTRKTSGKSGNIGRKR